MLKQIQKNFLKNSECNIDSANRASLACGPLLMCALAQTKNAEKLQELRKVKGVKCID